MSRRRARWLLVLLTLAAAALTLGPLPDRLLDTVVATVRAVGDLPEHPTRGVVERLSNVALFVPLALLACWAAPRVPRALVWMCCTLVSVGVELAQLVFLADRTPSVTDIVGNSVGAAVGVFAHRALSRPRRARLPSAPRRPPPARSDDG